jgi:succinyl-CoA synthetase beta subunit
MKIHEYQAKAILRGCGVPLPRGSVASTPAEARAAAQGLSFPVAVKAQVHVGGRGKAGGVKLAQSIDEVESHARAILGMNIKGTTVRKVLVEEGVDIQREIYLGLIIDRSRKLPVLMASAAGGVEIEEVAARMPEKILKLTVRPDLGLRDYQSRAAAQFLELPPTAGRGFLQTAQALYKAFDDYDCSLAEINPLAVTGRGEIVACDAKMNFDDNALYRHPDIEALRDEGEEEPLETEARRQKISYVKLDGKIGCIVNGAGLAMATMDLVKHFGGQPANFLDIGGAAKAEQVREALRIIASDPAVNTILFNIFGGIVRCDRVAEGVLQALDQLDLEVPIVIRLSGTNEDKAREMLKGTRLVSAPTMSEAARKAVEVSAA